MSREEFERKAQALWEEVVLTSGIDIADPAELVRKQVEIALAPAWSERLLDQETSKVIADAPARTLEQCEKKIREAGRLGGRAATQIELPA